MNVSEDRFLALFRDCESAFKLEYQTDPVPGEMEVFRAWQEGRPRLPEGFRPWQDWLSYIRSVGRKVVRVRLVDEPPTPYQEFLTWAVPYHREAGEDIRTMPRGLAVILGITPANWWLFDSDRVVTMNMDATGMTLVTGQETVKTHCAWRDLALSRAD